MKRGAQHHDKIPKSKSIKVGVKHVPEEKACASSGDLTKSCSAQCIQQSYSFCLSNGPHLPGHVFWFRVYKLSLSGPDVFCKASFHCGSNTQRGAAAHLIPCFACYSALPVDFHNNPLLSRYHIV